MRPGIGTAESQTTPTPGDKAVAITPVSAPNDVWRDLTPPFSTHSSAPSTSNAPSPEDSSVTHAEDGVDSVYDLAEHLDKMSVSASDRFFGPASTFALAKRAMDLRSQYVGSEPNPREHPTHDWGLQPV